MEKIQRAKIGVSGSFVNQLMSNNSSVPEVGKGATQLHYSDRTCFEVIEVSTDGKTVKLEALNAVADKTKDNEMGHQNWIFNPTGRFITVVWRNNAWKVKNNVIVFSKEFQQKHENESYYRALTPEQKLAVYGHERNVRPMNVVQGITEQKVEYSKINILFGVKNYYYDWSF